MKECDEARALLGGYALEALEPEEARLVAEHLSRCGRCRDELDELSSASSLLRGSPARELAAEAEEVPRADAALSAIAEARARERRRLRVLGIGTLGAGAAFLVALSVAVSLASRPIDSFAPAVSPTSMRPVARAPAAATVRLTRRPWGTQVDLVTTRLPALPAGAYYELWLVRANGSRVAAGTFRPTTPDGRARVRLAAALPLTEVVRIGVTRKAPGGDDPILSASRS